MVRIEGKDEPDGTITISGVPGPRGTYDSKVRAFVEYFLGESIEAYARRRRAEDPPRSYQGIADDMAEIIVRTAAELDPSRPPLQVRIDGSVPFQALADKDGEAP
jgi:hypothetical protein